MSASAPDPVLNFRFVTEETLPEVAKQILGYGGHLRLYLLEGPPGAGKTTLIQTLLRHLGVREVVTSPTFALVQLYHNEKGQRFAHLDLYRIESASEAEEAGLEEILQEPYDKIFVEWPSQVPELFDEEEAVVITLHPVGAERMVTVRLKEGV